MTVKNKSRKAQTAHIKQQELKASLAHLPLHGEIVTWETAEGVTYPLNTVIAALRSAGLPETNASELSPRFAFTRAAKKLEEEDRLIETVPSLSADVCFQLTKKAYEAIDGETSIVHSKEVLLYLDTSTGTVSCANKNLEANVQRMVNEAAVTKTASDISAMINKMFSKEADLFPLRKRGGVYFVPIQYVEFNEKISNLLTSLNGRMNRIPVPIGSDHGDKAIQDAVVTGISEMIEEHNTALDAFTIHTQKHAIENNAERIKQTRFKIEAYQSYLKDKAELLENALKESEKKLAQKISHLSSERQKASENGSLEGRDKWGAALGKASGAINAKLTTTPQSTEKIAELAGLPVSRVKSHLTYWLARADSLGAVLEKNEKGWYVTSR